jgi:hypothetical protein
VREQADLNPGSHSQKPFKDRTTPGHRAREVLLEPIYEPIIPEHKAPDNFSGILFRDPYISVAICPASPRCTTKKAAGGP